MKIRPLGTSFVRLILVGFPLCGVDREWCENAVEMLESMRCE